MTTPWVDIHAPGQIRLLGSLEPEEVLYEFDAQPWIYTSRSPLFGLLLVYLADEDAEQRRYRYLITNHRDESVIDDLKAGRISVYDALTTGELMFVADRAFDGSWVGAVPQRVASLPVDILPDRSTPLLPEHNKAFGGTILGALSSQPPPLQERPASQTPTQSVPRKWGHTHHIFYHFLIEHFDDLRNGPGLPDLDQVEVMWEAMDSLLMLLLKTTPERRAVILQALSRERASLARDRSPAG